MKKEKQPQIGTATLSPRRQQQQQQLEEEKALLHVPSPNSPFFHCSPSFALVEGSPLNSPCPSPLSSPATQSEPNVTPTSSDSPQRIQGFFLNPKNLTIQERISGKGRTDVYSCYVDGWQCAMKEIRLDKKGATAKNLYSEINILTSLPPHPNVVRYLYSTQSKGFIRLFMAKYTANLSERIHERWEQYEENQCDLFSVMCISRWMLEICRGLMFLHQHNVVHRDLKPANIFITCDERNEIKSLVLGDFDTAKLLDKDQAAKTFVGTPLYMAPELMNQSSASGFTYSADIFGFGLVLFELMTLRRPHYNIPRKLVPQKIIEGKRPDLPEDLPAEYAPLAEIFRDCTYADPAERPKLIELKEKLLLLA